MFGVAGAKTAWKIATAMSRKIQTEDAYYIIGDDSAMNETELRKLSATLDERTRITQPNFIIDMRFDFEFVQLQALWFITRLLQPIIESNIRNQSSLFVETDSAFINRERNEVEVVIPLQTFGQHRKYYPALRKALADLAIIRVSYPRMSHKIRKTIQGAGALCSYVAFSRNEHNLRQELVHVFFSLDIATCLVSPEIGFTQLIQETLLASKNVYTSKIYMYICRAADGGKWTIGYEKLREILCVGEKFRRYYDFRNRILKEAEKELRCNSNHWFDLVERFPRRGVDPDLLIFNIHSVSEDLKGSREYKIRIRNISETLEGRFRLPKSTIQQLLRQINLRNIDYIWQKHSSLTAYIAANQENIGNQQGYYVRTMQRIIEQERYSQSATQQTLFDI